MPTRTAADAVKLAQDSKWWRERFFYIVNPLGEKVAYRQKPAQVDYYKNKTNDDLILKARKEGFSSEIEGDFLFDCFTKSNVNAVTMAHTMDDTLVHMNRIQYYLDTMGIADFKFETIPTDEKSQKQLYFPVTNSYYWIGTAGSKSWGRGRDVNRLHLSEVAHYTDQKVLTAVFNSCTPNARKVLETTANGVGEAFHTLWVEADDPKSGSPWKQHFFAWWMDPNNRAEVREDIVFTAEELKMAKLYKLDDEQLYWYRKKKASQADKSLMAQEYPSNPREAFISSGRHVFNLQHLDSLKKKFVEEPEWTGEVFDDGQTVEFKDNPEGRLQIWKMPREGRKYIITADVAKGIPGGAWSVGCVADRSSWEVCAQWRSRIDAGAFGDILCDLGYFFNNALLAPENNNMGAATIERIHARKYPHVLNSRELWPDDKNPEDGFPTDEVSKNLCISALRSWIDRFAWAEHSDVAIKEMERAVWNEAGKMVSEGGFLDTVITRMILAYCMKFLTVDETYREKDEDDSPIVVSHVAKVSRGRGR